MNQIVIKVPLAMRELANRISRSLEPDTGGDHVFDSVTDDTHAIAEIPTCERYVTNFLALYQNTPDLVAFVAADYAARWPDFEVPTLAEVSEFCALVECTADTPVDAAGSLINSQAL